MTNAMCGIDPDDAAMKSTDRTSPKGAGDGFAAHVSRGQNSANHLVLVEWPSKFDSLNGRDGRPRPSHLSAGWRCEWRELDSLKSMRLAIRFLRVLSGRKASHGAARPPRPTISGNPACSTLRRFRGQTLSCVPRPGLPHAPARPPGRRRDNLHAKSKPGNSDGLMTPI